MQQFAKDQNTLRSNNFFFMFIDIFEIVQELILYYFNIMWNIPNADSS